MTEPGTLEHGRRRCHAQRIGGVVPAGEGHRQTEVAGQAASDLERVRPCRRGHEAPDDVDPAEASLRIAGTHRGALILGWFERHPDARPWPVVKAIGDLPCATHRRH